MLNPQRSSPSSGASRRTRAGWQQTPERSQFRTPDLIQQVRRVPPTYLGLAGVLLMLVGFLTSASWLIVGVGVALMIAAGVMSAARPRTKVMYWRGRRIELTEEPATGFPPRRW